MESVLFWAVVALLLTIGVQALEIHWLRKRIDELEHERYFRQVTGALWRERR